MGFNVPDLGPLRLATIKDVPRIANVATAGFYYSPVFKLERPYHAHHPRSTMMSYRRMFAEQIRDRDFVVLVATDKADPNEDSSTDANIFRDGDNERPEYDQKIVVGVASWQLPPQSPLKDQYTRQVEGGDEKSLVFDGDDGADKDHSAAKQLDDACVTREKRVFQREMVIMDMLVVHPAYWHRRHGRTLVNWGVDLARAHQVDVGVAAAETGFNTFRNCEFTEVEHVSMPLGTEKVVVGFLINAGETEKSRSRNGVSVWTYVVRVAAKLCLSVR